MLEYQSAYGKNFSCETPLVKIINDCLWNMENQQVTSIVAIDLSAAFDTVDHLILIDVLNRRFNIGGVALKWFANYLTSWSCKVIVKDAHSTEKRLIFSVPQGSVAGPVLYNVYASTLKEVASSSIELHGFADDYMIEDSFKPNADQESKVIQTDWAVHQQYQRLDGCKLVMYEQCQGWVPIGWVKETIIELCQQR